MMNESLCRQLAYELAEIIDIDTSNPKTGRYQASRPMPRKLALAYTRRNVALGLQGRCDLETL